MFKTTSRGGPRKIAETHNRPELFADAADDAEKFNATEGIPNGPGLGGLRAEKDVRSVVANPPDPPAPCRNLRRDK